MRGVEGGLHAAGGAGELDDGAARVDVNAGESLGGEPRGDGGEIAVGGAEGGAEALRRKPLVEAGGAAILLPVEELLQRGLLLGAAREDEMHAIEGGAVRHGALIEGGTREGMDVARAA